MPKTERSRTKVIALLGSGASYREIAEAVGCSKRTVIRIAKDVKPDLEQVDGQLQKYQRLIRKRLTLTKRVGVLETVMNKAKSHPFAALRAIERADDLDGILTAKDLLRERQDLPANLQPMFILPAGTNIAMQIGLKDVKSPPGNHLAASLTREVDTMQSIQSGENHGDEEESK